jgi:hypothetical protein
MRGIRECAEACSVTFRCISTAESGAVSLSRGLLANSDVRRIPGHGVFSCALEPQKSSGVAVV